ncbi:MAG: ABC transporter permease [Roseivirga sp.]
MVKNYIKTAFRSLYKHKGFTVINIFGLSIGIAMATLLGRFIQEELSYDKFYIEKNRIYRLYSENVINGRERGGITGSGLMAPTLAASLPEVEVAGRTHRVGSAVIEYNGARFIENMFAYADNGFLDIMEVEFLEGNPTEALSTPSDFVISTRLAEKVFGTAEGLLGKTITINDEDKRVTGVIKDMPKNSHYAPRAGFLSNNSMSEFSWNRVGHVTYVRLLPDIDPAGLAEKFDAIARDNILPVLPEDSKVTLGLYPVTDIWLSESPTQYGGGSKSSLYAFGLIAFFILLLAVINYMNLATARSMKRAKEVGMRKVIGARRLHIMLQFLTESVILCVGSMLIGGFLAEVCTGIFNDLTGKTVEIGFMENPEVLMTLLVFGLVLGLLSGLYPAVFLSAFKPVRVLKSAATGSKTNRNVRRVLVSLQFVISIALIVATLVVYKQVNSISDKDLGYTSEQVLAIPLAKADTSGIIKNGIKALPGVSAATSTNLLPATGDSGATFIIKDEQDEEHRDIISMASIDYDYLETMQFTLLGGRNFSADFATDINAMIINETMVKKYGWKEPIGKTISMNGENEVFTVVGVVKDFNMLSLYEPVKPFAFFLKPKFDWGAQYILAKLNVVDASSTVTQIEEVYNKVEKSRPFSSVFIDDYFERVYQEETRRAQVYLTFSIITILIACIGLFGLVTFVLQQKMKEISIRKVLGASLSDIVQLISREFVITIVISSLIATPLAYYFMQDWLNGFEYRTSIGAGSFMIAAGFTLLIALLTISTQSLRASRTNPVDTLSQE